MDKVNHEEHAQLFTGLAKAYTKEVDNISRAIAKCAVATPALDSQPKTPAFIMCAEDRTDKANPTATRRPEEPRGGKDKQGGKPQFAKQATEEVREAKQDNQHQGNRGWPEIVQCNACRACSGCATPPLIL